MSATLRADTFAAYFGDSTPRLKIGSSMYPVQTFYLEDALKQTNFLALRDGSSNWVSTGRNNYGRGAGGGDAAGTHQGGYARRRPEGGYFDDRLSSEADVGSYDASDLELLSKLWKRNGLAGGSGGPSQLVQRMT